MNKNPKSIQDSIDCITEQFINKDTTYDLFIQDLIKLNKSNLYINYALPIFRKQEIK